MIFRRRTSLLFIMCMVWLLLAVAGGLAYLHALSRIPPNVDRISVTKIISDFNSHHQVYYKLDFSDAFQKVMATELYDPNAVVPSPTRYDRETLSAILRHGAACLPLQHGDDWKLVAWFDFKCGRTKSLDPAVWRKPPLIHPLGGTWAHWLHEQGYGDQNWLLAEKDYLHVLERGDLPESSDTREEFKVFRHTTPGELERLVQRESVIVGSTWVFILAFPDGNRVHVFSRSDWDKYMASAAIQPSSLGSEACQFTYFLQCWNVRSDLRATNHLLYLYWMFAAMGGLVLTVLMSLWLRAREEAAAKKNQQLVMQTLTHELRYPVTGLNLSIEVLRSHYDGFSEQMKVESMRLIGLTTRMNRLVDVSQQYLKLLAEDEQFTFRQDNIASLSTYLDSVLEPYEAKLIKQEGEDFACAFDGYWVGTCIANLIKNALMHGQPPIIVSWKRVGTDVQIVVQNSGPAPSAPLSELVKPRIRQSLSAGMGLGLSLVHRLVNLMDGDLTLQAAPTRFILTFRGVCHDQAAAS